MKCLSAARCSFVLAIASGLGLGNCQDPAVGTIKAERGAIEKLQSGASGRPAPPAKSSRNRPDYNDLSPKLPAGGDHR
jgi:hypothetical protein